MKEPPSVTLLVVLWWVCPTTQELFTGGAVALFSNSMFLFYPSDTNPDRKILPPIRTLEAGDSCSSFSPHDTYATGGEGIRSSPILRL